MIEAAANLLVVALVGVVALAVTLWPEMRRLRKLRRENDELRSRLASAGHSRGVRPQRRQLGTLPR